jgi:Uma2 family endonuclease
MRAVLSPSENRVVLRNVSYVQNVERVLGKDRIDLTADPPPDLVLEVDIATPSISKPPLFAEFGVPEVWCFRMGSSC